MTYKYGTIFHRKKNVLVVPPLVISNILYIPSTEHKNNYLSENMLLLYLHSLFCLVQKKKNNRLLLSPD